MPTRHPSPDPRVVVVLAPSQAGHAALAWAIDEAERRDARLELVAFAETRTPREALLLDDAIEQLGDTGAPVRAILTRGPRGRELRSISEGAGLLVLGEPISPELLADPPSPIVAFNADATVETVAGFDSLGVAA